LRNTEWNPWPSFILKQGDQMCLWKNRPKWSKTRFVKIRT
jgi:hypothetical protein